jgi:peptidoglycan/xylan/chitin deacetylase (PgdA/CDA1 family)
MLPVLFELHTRRWAEDAKPGVFGWDRKRAFYSALSAQLLRRGWLRFSWLEWNTRIVACQYGFLFGNTYYHLQEGHEPASEHWSFGTALRAWSIREFLNAGVREYDFLSGVGWHKTHWGAETKMDKRVLLAGASGRSALFCRGPKWEIRLRESVKAIFPEKLLAARRAIHEKRSRSMFANDRNGDAAQPAGERWLLKTAATCYFHLKLPALTRSLQERYQVCISPTGKRPGISLARRRQASVRILCYHRINDEHNPFFPAISTSSFERQMRFLASHYKVVSLAAAIEHLHGGAADPVLVITFDDGYEDNYQNAFPILQRYGLPATVFLTTGSIDAQQPIWFSRMAHAFKTTDRQFVDLEIDIPRRFRMRTEEDRLDSNRQVFNLLRASSDSDRQYWYDRVLRDLGVRDDRANPDRMLRWDQVRLMKAGGIDFGSHTVNHPFLSKVDPEQAGWEICESKRRIEEELELPVLHFAYPNGREVDLSAGNKELLRRAGYQAAVSTIWGTNFRCTDPMELRRGQPWEDDQALFAYKLAWYQLSNA